MIPQVFPVPIFLDLPPFTLAEDIAEQLQIEIHLDPRIGHYFFCYTPGDYWKYKAFGNIVISQEHRWWLQLHCGE